jgi:hypothetical protein
VGKGQREGQKEKERVREGVKDRQIERIRLHMSANKRVQITAGPLSPVSIKASMSGEIASPGIDGKVFLDANHELVMTLQVCFFAL